MSELNSDSVAEVTAVLQQLMGDEYAAGATDVYNKVITNLRKPQTESGRLAEVSNAIESLGARVSVDFAQSLINKDIDGLVMAMTAMSVFMKLLAAAVDVLAGEAAERELFDGVEFDESGEAA